MKYDFSKWHSCDTFFTSAKYQPFSLITRWAENPWGHKLKYTFDQSVATHVGMIYDDCGQKMLCEMTADGCVGSSPEKYKRDSDKIIAVYRWRGFNDEKRSIVEQYMALCRRRKIDYEFTLLGRYSWLTKWLPIKNRPDKMTCNDFWCEVHEQAGLNQFVDLDTPPHPQAILHYVSTSTDWLQIA